MLLQRFLESLGDSDPMAAQLIVPVLVRDFHPRKVVDFGCGSGTWVRAFCGTSVEAVGFDLRPPEGAAFRECDFEREMPSETGDMAICLETAEHLSSSRAEALVDALCRFQVVIFAAGIPLQGGWNHVNEQWPEYWDNLFRNHGYACSEDLRWKFWNDRRIPAWYRQDLLVFAREDALKRYGYSAGHPLSVVHPDAWDGIGMMGIWQRAKRSVTLKAAIIAMVVLLAYAAAFSATILQQ